ncbi:MAG: peptidoglycan DL-endopeptidase CwlO [Gemmatimonadales bacterium]|nr:peptidoglycan DL-endopeptidase CwlO [Gemmatimonadales bacterium]
MSRSQRLVRLLLWGAVLYGPVPHAGAQTIEARIGRFFEAGGWTTYRIGLRRPLIGILGVQFHGDLLRAVGVSGGMAGVGTDLTAFRKGVEGPYLVAGLSGGLGSQTSNDLSNGWGSWSAGAGYDVFPASFLSVGVEGRWRELSLGRRNGFELGVGLTFHLGGSSPPAGPRPLPGPAPNSISSSESLPLFPDVADQAGPASLADSIVATAAAAMGRPYQFGGTGAGGGGFDCSGLIQYAYKQHGIVLARRSVDQAKEGKKVDRKLDRLRPADLLTFTNRGGPVTHVGLYIGGGRFIHSATRGVQISTLSAQDPYGRWWYRRWVGVRRIVK